MVGNQKFYILGKFVASTSQADILQLVVPFLALRMYLAFIYLVVALFRMLGALAVLSQASGK